MLPNYHWLICIECLKDVPGEVERVSFSKHIPFCSYHMNPPESCAFVAGRLPDVATSKSFESKEGDERKG